MGFENSNNWDGAVVYRVPGLKWRKALFRGGGVIYKSNVRGQTWKIRLNDFPDEPMYSLLVEGREIIHFDEWPSEWIKPGRS